MARADKGDLILALAQRLDQRVDADADNAENMACTPRDQGFDNDVGGVHILGDSAPAAW
jgi:hypothetical protein